MTTHWSKVLDPAAQEHVDPQRGEGPHIRIPSPLHRPGDAPEFRGFPQQPGDLTRPDPLCAAEETTAHANGLVRVMGDDHVAAGEWDPELDPATLHTMLEHIMRMRIFDDRMMTMQRQGKLSFYLESKMEEGCAVAAGMALRDDDILVPSYRQPALQFVRGRSMVDMICHCIGNVRDNVKGRQMPVHYSWKEGNFVSISSPVGTQFPQAVGMAMASAYRGEDIVTAAWLGEGTSAQGDFHYALNFASVYAAPVILTVVNNQWAISTHRNIATGGKSFAARGLAYDVASIRVDGNDVLATHAVMAWAAERARRGGGPALIEAYTYRGAAHSSSDDPSRYRPGDEPLSWPGGDPLERLREHLIGIGEWSEDRHTQLAEAIDVEVIAAYKEAESYGTLSDGPHPPVSTLFTDVYVDTPGHLRRQREELGL